MAIKWKDAARFKPAVVLNRIQSIRSFTPDGKTSFVGFGIEDALPALRSMLIFPESAIEAGISTLIWKAIGRVKDDLTPPKYLDAINAELSDRLATVEQTYFFLTTLSIDSKCIPNRLSILGADIRIYSNSFPKKFIASRKALLDSHSLETPFEPTSYCKLVIRVKAKNSDAAVHRALRALDLQRALWCLMGNPGLELVFGGILKPINVVRLGSRHTLHTENGAPATDGIWHEPSYIQASIFNPRQSKELRANSRFAMDRLSACRYGEKITAALLRFVRALDEPDANTAFVRMWGALEALVTPNMADYDRLVQRCSFLWKDSDYNRQILEHLREYRNRNIHAGEESDVARTGCFQLQNYFSVLIWFHLNNQTLFQSLDEANSFLDLEPDKKRLERRLLLTKKALKMFRKEEEPSS